MSVDFTKADERRILRQDVSIWRKFKRWCGFFTEKERAALIYARMLKIQAYEIATRKTIMTSRPEWMREKDYAALRKLQLKAERKPQLNQLKNE